MGFRTLQDIKRERSDGSIQTMNRIFAVLGLKLGVVRAAPDPEDVVTQDGVTSIRS